MIFQASERKAAKTAALSLKQGGVTFRQTIIKIAQTMNKYSFDEKH
jgi:hypothetical protein